MQNRKENYKRNGWRHAIFGTRTSQLFKDHYKGKWQNDEREGKGTELTRNGWLYEGDWHNNKKHGIGVLIKVTETGTIKSYAGNWVDGKKEGFGAKWYKNGSYYEGMFWQNKRHGHGCIWYGDGSYYEGRWQNDRYHGEGMLVQANGDRYEGQFLHGEKEGHGIFYHLDTGQLQIGYWEKGICTRSIMEDINWRQSAPHPTPYPIPKVLAD